MEIWANRYESNGSKFVTAKNCDLHHILLLLLHGNWGFHTFSMVSAMLVLIIKVLCLHHCFHYPRLSLCHFIYIVSFVIFLSDNLISPGMVPFVSERKHEIIKLMFYFPFIACLLYFIFFLKLFFLYFYDMSEIFVHFLLSCI